MNQLKWRHFQRDIILLNVRWYLAYPVSYRNLAEMNEDRGLTVDHTTLYRWVQAYSPCLEENFQKRKRPVSSSWPVPILLAAMGALLLGLPMATPQVKSFYGVRKALSLTRYTAAAIIILALTLGFLLRVHMS